MAAQIQDGIEIEIVVRSRKNWKPVGKAGHVHVVSAGESAGEAGRKRIAEELKTRVNDYLKSRLDVSQDAHTKTGNCGIDSVTMQCPECGDGNICDVCHVHDEPRGECGECRTCRACG